MNISKSQIRNLIKESINNMINEIGDTNRGQYMLGRVHARNTDKYADSLDAGDEDTDARSTKNNAFDNWSKPTREDGKPDYDNDPFTKGEDDERNGDPSKIHDRYNVYKYKDQFDLRDKFIDFIESDDTNLQDIYDYETGIATGNIESALTALIPKFEEKIGYEITPDMRKTVENAYNEWLYYARENGFLDENKIRKSQLRNLIRESIRNVVNEGVEFTGEDPNEEETYYMTRISEIYDEIAKLKTAVNDDRFKEDIDGLERYIKMMQAHVRKLRQDDDYMDMPTMADVLDEPTPMVNY